MAGLLVGVEAADFLILVNLHQAGLFLHAALGAVLAAGSELTALGQVQRMGHSAGDGVQTGSLGVQSGNRTQQALGVGMGMLGIVSEEHLCRNTLHDLAAVHNGHVVCHLVDNTQVMGDEHNGGAMLLLQHVHQVASVAAAMICPIVNSGVFFLGCLTFFMSEIRRWALTDFGDHAVLYILFGLIGFNFVLEFAINAIFSPMVTYVIRVGKKIHFKQ